MINTCPYCKKNGNPYNEYYYECKNHNNVLVYWSTNEISDNKLIFLLDNFSRICIDLELNNMNIAIYNKNLTDINIPFDPSLTPEKFESKLKTYLNFL